ncbi:hypothetical protein [Kitasatospora sp. NPDC002040]|uniref:hypothetical protein n=1 Tax=Kitasatospora sp. NPDC002040 TaxID=3154661 RepID=UPI0033247634
MRFLDVVLCFALQGLLYYVAMVMPRRRAEARRLRAASAEMSRVRSFGSARLLSLSATLSDGLNGMTDSVTLFIAACRPDLDDSEKSQVNALIYGYRPSPRKIPTRCPAVADELSEGFPEVGSAWREYLKLYMAMSETDYWPHSDDAMRVYPRFFLADSRLQIILCELAEAAVLAQQIEQ